MAEQQFASFGLLGVSAIVYYDDVELRITRVEITNSGANACYAEIKKLTNPKRTFSQTFPSGANASYSLPKGFTFQLVPHDDGSEGYSCPDITCYVRSG